MTFWQKTADYLNKFINKTHLPAVVTALTQEKCKNTKIVKNIFFKSRISA